MEGYRLQQQQRGMIATTTTTTTAATMATAAADAAAATDATTQRRQQRLQRLQQLQQQQQQELLHLDHLRRQEQQWIDQLQEQLTQHDEQTPHTTQKRLKLEPSPSPSLTPQAAGERDDEKSLEWSKTISGPPRVGGEVLPGWVEARAVYPHPHFM